MQHCDHDPEFKKSVLALLEEQVELENAEPAHVTLLTDRIRINEGKKQYCGTQVQFGPETGWNL